MAPWWGDDGGWWHVTYAARMDRRVSMAACNTVDNIIMVASMDGAINYFEIQHPEGGNGQNGWAHDDAVY